MGNDEPEKDNVHREVLKRGLILEEKSQTPIREVATQESTLERPTSPVTVQQTVTRPNPRLNTSPTHGLWALTHRDLRKWYTNPYQLIISLVQPVIWMGLFGKALNFTSFITAGAGPGVNANAILQSFFGTTNYFSYLVCGMVVFIVLFNSAFSGMSVVWDRRFGFMNKPQYLCEPRDDRDG